MQIKHAMEQLPDIRKLINAPFNATFEEYGTYQGLTPLQSYLTRHGDNISVGAEEVRMNMEVVRTLIDIGADIDKVYSEGFTVYPVGSYLKLPGGQPSILHLCISNENNKNKKMEWRKILELLLYENISLDMNKTAVGFGLKHYKHQVFCESRRQARFTSRSRMNHAEEIDSGSYMMDAELHESAFDFAVPLLMEAGFDYTRADIEDAIHFPIVPTDDSGDEKVETQRRGIGAGGPFPLEKIPVLEYLEKCLDGPRPLTCLCRTVLRKHFPRRQIHRYVFSVNILKEVKDFLLLRPLLQRLPDYI